MPELPDILLYLGALAPRVQHQPLDGIRVRTPFLVRTVDPPLSAAEGRIVHSLRRLGKRIVLGLEGELYLVLHLMIAGRLRWADRGAKLPGRIGLCAFDFPTGTLILTEAGSKRRASLHLVAGEAGLNALDPGGLEVLEASLEAFTDRLQHKSHTVKRALTDPRLFSGIGNAYSDEILHRAGLSPFKRTQQLDEAECHRLYQACQTVLGEWVERLKAQTGDRFPKKVTAFRKEMAVHGRYREPCPVCGAPVQRIAYADKACNYCPGCQTGGRILKDRSLSRLLKEDWPASLAELEEAGDRRTKGDER